jgi:hypothetical protein
MPRNRSVAVAWTRLFYLTQPTALYGTARGQRYMNYFATCPSDVQVLPYIYESTEPVAPRSERLTPQIITGKQIRKAAAIRV